MWECEATDKVSVPDFTGKKLMGFTAPRQLASHWNTALPVGASSRVFVRARITNPYPSGGPDPFFDWLQERIKIGEMTLVLAFTVGEDGRAHSILIVRPTKGTPF